MHEGACLARPLPHHVAQRAVEQVGARVIAHRVRSPVGVHVGAQGVAQADLSAKRAAVHGQARGLRAGDALDVLDLEQDRAIRRADDAGVGHLAAALRVERRPVQDDLRVGPGLDPELHLVDGLERFVFHAVPQDRDHAPPGGRRLVAQELRGSRPAEDLGVPGRGQRRLGQAGLRVAAAALALLGQRVLEPGQVRAHAVLGRQLHREVDREAVRIVEAEAHRAREHRGIGRERLGQAADRALR